MDANKCIFVSSSPWNRGDAENARHENAAQRKVWNAVCQITLRE